MIYLYLVSFLTLLKIFSHTSERISSDPEVIQSALLFNPELLYSVGCGALTDEMIEYATQRGLEINENTITNAILSSKVFVRKFLPIYPSLYKKTTRRIKK